MARPRPIKPPEPLSIDSVLAKEQAAMPDPNAPQGQTQAPQAQQQAPQGPQGQQAPAQTQAQTQGQGQLPPDKAEQVARSLIQSHPQMFAHLHQQGQGQAPAGAQAAPADLLKYLPQAIAFVQAFYAALQAAGIPGI